MVLSIDDMRSTAPYEKCLRPIIERLKKIDGRGPVSIMTSQVDPADPQLPKWLAEGVNVEAHTATHPCPCLQGGDLAKAKQTYDDAIDLLAKIPGGRAMAFRMPCCDSMNSVGPRFFTEMFGKTTAGRQFPPRRLVGVPGLHRRRSGPAAVADHRRRRPAAVHQVHSPRPQLRQLRRELSLSLRHRPPVLGNALAHPRRLVGHQPAGQPQPGHRPRHESRHRRGGAQTGHLHADLPSRPLDPQRPGHRADRPRDQPLRQRRSSSSTSARSTNG